MRLRTRKPTQTETPSDNLPNPFRAFPYFPTHKEIFRIVNAAVKPKNREHLRKRWNQGREIHRWARVSFKCESRKHNGKIKIKGRPVPHLDRRGSILRAQATSWCHARTSTPQTRNTNSPAKFQAEHPGVPTAMEIIPGYRDVRKERRVQEDEKRMRRSPQAGRHRAAPLLQLSSGPLRFLAKNFQVPNTSRGSAKTTAIDSSGGRKNNHRLSSRRGPRSHGRILPYAYPLFNIFCGNHFICLALISHGASWRNTKGEQAPPTPMRTVFY